MIAKESMAGSLLITNQAQQGGLRVSCGRERKRGSKATGIRGKAQQLGRWQGNFAALEAQSPRRSMHTFLPGSNKMYCTFNKLDKLLWVCPM